MASKGGGFITAFIGAVLGSVLTIVAISQNLIPIGNMDIPNENTGNPTTSISIEGESMENVYKAVVQKSMPSVVGITTVTTVGDLFFGTRQASGVGTGVIVDERGYILTNSHVVNDGAANQVRVLFYDGTTQDAEVLWNEKALDLAVIKVDTSGLPVAELGNSDEVEVGDLAIAIGNPLGLDFERTVTQGIISGLNRSIQIEQNLVMDNLIQTDASINPGNSGGPLLNSRGQVIGINSAKVSTGEGLGFAIPINMAKPIVDQFIEKGEFQRVYVGIRGIDLEYYKQATGEDFAVEEGVYIVDIEPSGAAEAVGILEGDIIVELGSSTITNMSTLVRELYKYRPGDTATIKILRGTEEMEFELTF
ncbi:S1-C subfamily serine protease [Acetoanaerobium pronyense]|uniref:S1-C subfamily serine protease n=1 Tax=Acetoanaerobium pronyense TaxID=1482736 RepID=A0ABS4KLS0_9FIRM|nr:trypsin-like peptidase domain-containing protein [Acetoanaerobium pronyense]MBP2028719.1 S1-C subfamily serine protease [Acetoanaerobium pronyense]